MKNAEIRASVRDAGLHLWEVAYHLGMSDSSFSRKLRRELTEADRERVLRAIKELKREMV